MSSAENGGSTPFFKQPIQPTQPVSEPAENEYESKYRKYGRRLFRRANIAFSVLVGIGIGLIGLVTAFGLEELWQFFYSLGGAFIIVGAVGQIMSLLTDDVGEGIKRTVSDVGKGIKETVIDVGEGIKKTVREDGDKTRTILKEMSTTLTEIKDGMDEDRKERKIMNEALRTNLEAVEFLLKKNGVK